MISLICENYGIKNYTINGDGSIDVDGDVWLYKKGLTELPLTFNRVDGDFICNENLLTTLKGSPRWVGGSFACSRNQLTSLEFSPDYVGDNFYCYNNQLTSLEFCPDYVGGDFRCGSNYLTDNYSETEIGGYFYTSLKHDGLIINDYDRVINYNEWRKLYKRKKILNDIFNM